jgi:pimeloyl-ACP methyl ester carboxylesterase
MMVNAANLMPGEMNFGLSLWKVKRDIMKTKVKQFLLILIAGSIPALQSCKEKTVDPFSDNTYLVSATRAVTMTKSNVQTLITTFASAYPEINSIYADIKTGIVVYSIKYNTTFQGENIVASGLVVVPDAVGSYPVISFQNGTNTVYSNAPSVNPLYTLYQMVECIASEGYVVVIPDYIGFGASKDIFHPYLHKESTVKSIVDMLYSVKELDEDVAKDATFLNEYYLLGYSQGGWATLALLDALENDYQSDFTVKACCCGAGPYDISYFNSYVLGLTTYPMPSFLAYIAKSYSDHGFFTNPLSDLFQPAYVTAIDNYFDGMHSTTQINEALTTSIASLFKADYISGYASDSKFQSVRDALSVNSIEPWNSSVPLLFTHGTDDVYVPPVISENMHNAMINAGTSSTTCTYITIPGKDHTGAIVPSCIAGLNLFNSLKK